ncbi:FAD binding protein type 2 [Echinococcus multilocularis]|uniref:FAD binding protein type 2 n=1 Tax=Echinococcus multilocularis TaxID=6211 RepID=A0A068Y1C4_ECHMU|nr:FAD binding protein type 2 [Echinococcus multilocularis]
MNEIDINYPFDPLLVESLATELQLHIGTLPRVEVYYLHLEAYAGDVLQCLRVQPRSLTEISRTVRAAKTMKLTVRGMGHASGNEKVIYADRFTVIVDCCQLTDEPRMELVNIHRDGDDKDTPGLKVLAGVTINELVDYMIDHKVELYQSPDMIPGIGTIVGNIVTASPGVYAPVSGALGGCLADEVIAMRVVDSHGNLVQYSDPHKLEQYCANMGTLGVVYDVVLRVREMTSSLVEYDFQTWCKIITHESLKYSFRHNDLTELIYVPYNHLQPEKSLRKDWVPFQDEVIVRWTKRLSTIYSEDLGSAPRHRFHIIDPFTGPNQREIVSYPEQTPHILGRAYRVLKSKLRHVSLESQFTPWAMTCLAPPPSPLRMIRFAIETSCSMDPFFKFIKTLLEALMYMIRNEEGEEACHGLNLFMRVNFTGGNRSAKVMGTGSLNPTEAPGRRLIVHITFAHLMRSCSSEDWCDLAGRLTNFIFTFIPRSTLHWKSEWHTLQV